DPSPSIRALGRNKGSVGRSRSILDNLSDGRGAPMRIIFLLILVVAILVAILGIQNATPVSLTLLTVEVSSISLSLLLLVSVAVGALLMLFLGLGGWVGNRRVLRERDKTIARLEAELAAERSRSAMIKAEAAPP